MRKLLVKGAESQPPGSPGESLGCLQCGSCWGDSLSSAQGALWGGVPESGAVGTRRQEPGCWARVGEQRGAWLCQAVGGSPVEVSVEAHMASALEMGFGKV